MFSRTLLKTAHVLCLFTFFIPQDGQSAPRRASERRTSKAAKAPKVPFKVEAFTPTGIAPKDETISITFSMDAISTDALQTTTTAEALLLFDPTVEGILQWENTRKLRFMPRSGLKPCTPYVAKLNSKLKDLAGQTITGPTEFKFNTPPLTLKKVEQTGFTPDQKALITFVFSETVMPTDLHRYLSVSSEGLPLKWTIESDVNTRNVRIITDPVSTDTISVHLEPGMKSPDGPLAMTTAIDRPVRLTFKLTADELRARWERDKSYLLLTFSNSVMTEEIKKHIRIEPPVEYEVTDDGNRIKLRGDFKSQQRYTVHVLKGLMGYGGQLLLRDAVLSTWVPPMAPFLEMQEAGGHLSPAGQMQVRMRSSGLPKLRVFATRVYENNLVHYAMQGEGGYQAVKFGSLIANKEIEVSGPVGGVVDTRINLRDLLGEDSTGRFLIRVEADKPENGNADYDDSDDSYNGYNHGSRLTEDTLISISNLGLVTKQSKQQVTVWVASLNAAAPVAGAQVAAYTSKNQLVNEGQTDASGFVDFSGLSDDPEKKPAVVIAKSGNDICYLNLNDNLSGAEEFQSTGGSFLASGYEAYVSAERGAYRPGETVHLFGYVRGAGVTIPKSFPLEIELAKPDGRRTEPRQITLTDSGSFTIDYQVPAYFPTGLYHAHIQLPGTAKRREQQRTRSSGYYYDGDYYEDGERVEPELEKLGSTEFFVEEFLPNRLKVETIAPEKRYSTTEPLQVAVVATEMFGQPAANRTATATIDFTAAGFASSKFEQFTFGDAERKFTKREEHLDDLEIDESGGTTITVDIPDVQPPAALSAAVSISVQDIGGRAVTSRLTRLIDPLPYYIGSRVAQEGYPQVGKEVPLEVVALRPDETLIDSAEVTASVSRIKYNSILKREDGLFRFVSKRELVPVMETSATVQGGRGGFAFTPQDTGSYLLQVWDRNSSASGSLNFHVSSARWTEQPWSLEKPERLEIVLDKKAYGPGETARVLLKSPFPGTLLLSFEQDKVLSTTVLQMAENTLEVPVTVTEEHLPNFYVVATVIRPVKPAEKWLPHRAFGMANVVMDPLTRRLSMDIDLPEEVRPNAKLPVDISVVDTATSQAIQAGFNLWAVDEGVLSLTSYESADPLMHFYGARRLGVTSADFYSELMPDLLDTARAKSATGGDGGEDNRRQSPVSADRVKPVSLWLGTMKTDAAGKAHATFEIPQFMGQLRVMAVGATEKMFGKADANIYVRNPVMVKDNLPRMLAPGDKCISPFVIYNNTTETQTAQFTMSTSGPLNIDSFTPSVEIAPRAFASIRVPLEARTEGGVAVVRFGATMGDSKYEDSVELPVRPASPSVRRALYATADASAPYEAALQTSDFLDGTTTGSLIVSGAQSVGLAGGLQYNLRYPYGCVEQTCSAAFPLIYLSDLANQLSPGRYGEEGIRTKLQFAVDRIIAMQIASGGVSMWPGERTPWSWGSAYAAHLLVEAKKTGVDVSEAALSELLSYLQARAAAPPAKDETDPYTERAYITYIMALAGRKNIDLMESLYDKRAQLNPTARALLAVAYKVAGNDVVPGELLGAPGALAPRQTVRDTGGTLSSPARETAIMLAAILDTGVARAEVPALVHRLERMMNREGHWGSTQDNSFAMWALGKYAKQTAAATQSFAGTVTAGTKSYDFSSSEPLTLAASDLPETVTVAMSGAGTAYLSWVVEGVPLAPDTTPTSAGIGISRRYLDRDDQELQPEDFTQGKLVVVELELTFDRSLDNVVIEDLLPAGLEIENANLDTSEQLSGDDTPRGGISVRRTEARDDRMVVFANLHQNPKKKTIYKYAARVVSEGTFIVPPVQVGCMYDPDIFARTAASSLTVKGRK